MTSTGTSGGELRGILHSRDFRRLYATRLVSQFSDGVFQVALAGFVFFSPEQQTSAAKAAVAFAVLLLPYSLVGPFAGVFIDRWSRRQILVWSPLLRSGVVCVVAGLIAGTGRPGAAFYGAALIVLGVNRFFLASLSAGLPHVVRTDQLVLANAVSVTSGTIIAFVGAMAGYLLRRATGSGGAGTAFILLCSAAAYLLASLSALRLDRARLGPSIDDEHRRPREILDALRIVALGLAAGFHHLRERPQAALALAAISVHRFFYGIALIMTVLLFRYRFSSGSDLGLNGFALALSVSGAGFLAGAVITPAIVRRIGKDRWIVVQLLGAGAALAVLGLPFVPIPWIAGSFLLGVVSQGLKVCVDTIVQQTVADAFRGRVFAAYDMLFNATFVGAAAVAAVSVPADGRSVTVLLAVIAGYAVAAIAYRWLVRAVARGAAPAPGLPEGSHSTPG